MPTLEFKGKQFVYSHHLSVPLCEFKIDKKIPAGKIGCIFIDQTYKKHP